MNNKSNLHINSLPVLLRDPKILLIGGGKVALQKAQVLADNNIDFSLVSSAFIPEFAQITAPAILKYFEKPDAEAFNIIVDATGTNEVNRLIKEIKKERFVFVNTVDVPHECDFYFSSLLQYANLKIAISSDGASPTLTQVVRQKIKEYLPQVLGKLAHEKLLLREQGIVNIEKTRMDVQTAFGKVFLIGCGTGDAELLTLKAYKTIQTLDVVFYDYLITDEILAVVPEHVEKIFVGKCKGNHSKSQDEINQLLVTYARKGLRVGRLKNGDPYIFGRGAEEAEFVVKHNIPVEVIPGISSALAAPSGAGIPPTLRGVASNLLIVTGHLDGTRENLQWIDSLNFENQTTIVLMGLSQAGAIAEQASRKGVRKDLPAAIISNATRPNQKVIVSTVEDLAKDSLNAESPAVIVFGEVVNYRERLERLLASQQAELKTAPQLAMVTEEDTMTVFAKTKKPEAMLFASGHSFQLSAPVLQTGLLLVENKVS